MKKNKENFTYLLKALDRAPYPANVMARPLARRSPRRNPSPAGEDELASVVPTEGSGTPIPNPVVSRARTPAPATALAAALSSDAELFKQFIKAYLKAQVPG